MKRKVASRVGALMRSSRHLTELERVQAELADSEMRRRILADRVRSQGAEIERCRREHTDLARRNGHLQSVNVQLAARLEQTELRLAQRGLA